MTKYELLYIIPGKYTEEEVEPIKLTVNDWLAKNGAQLVRQQDLGKKKLAYPIQQNHYGYYLLADFDGAGEAVGQIDSALKLMPEILRHQIVHRLEPAKTTGQEPTTRPKIEAPTTTELAEPLIAKVQPRPTEPIKEQATKKPKISLAELGEKLDEILKEDII